MRRPGRTPCGGRSGFVAIVSVPALLLTVPLLLSSCHATEGSPLLDTRFVLVEIAGSAVPSADEGEPAPYLQLEAETRQARGYGAVNGFSGSYELSGEQLSFGPLAATRRAGSEAAMACEAAFLSALERTATWRLSGKRLELLDVGGDVLALLVAEP